jgi:DNA-binding LacI/PurR family transcriptional regulator
MKSRPTIIDVARRAGVSKSTVSRVVSGGNEAVSEETQHKVNTAIEELGYEYNALAGGMRSNRTYLIMLAIPDITNPFWPEVARGIQDRMALEGYGVIFANSDWHGLRENEFLRLARRNGLDGILINPIQVTNAELVATGIPTVILGLSSDYPNFDMVGSDSHGATLSALEYLYELGHRQVALLLGRPQGRLRRNRLDAYYAFLERHNLPMQPDWVVETPFEHSGGEAAMEQLIRLPQRPTAVLASNDVIAIGALHAAVTHGLNVPEELSIMGIDDIYAATVTLPPLSTVSKPKYQIGAQAAMFLLERMRGEAPPPRRVPIPCRLVPRGSTTSISAVGYS